MPAYKYKTKEGKTLWYCSFHYTDWTGANKRKKKMGFQTRREALEWERSFLDQGSKNPDILFSSLVKNYMEDNESRLKPTTLENKQFIFDEKLTPYFGNLKVSDIDPIRIRKWQNELMNYRDEHGKPYSQTYLKTINAQLSAIMNYAVRYYNLSKNPCHASGSMGKSRAGEMSIWTRDQFEHFLTFEKGSAYHCAFNTLFYTGMRVGELLALTPEDIPRDNASININKNYAMVNGVEMFLTPKTAKGKRIVAIHNQLHCELLEYIDNLYLDKEDRIFYFTRSGLSKEFSRRTENAGLPHIRLHDLRHSHVSMLIEMGVPIMEISKRLGHENPQTTMNIYAHLYPGKERNISDKIGALFEPQNMDSEDNF